MKSKLHFYSQLNYPLPRTAIEAEILLAARVVHLRFLKLVSGKTPREQSSSGKKIGAESAVLHFVFFIVIVNKMQQSAKENCLLKRNTLPEVFPLTIGSGKTKPFEKRHAGCEEREKINRRRIYDTLRINFFEATTQTACIFSKGDKNNPQGLRVHKHIFVGNSRLVTAMTHTDNNGDNAEQREKRYYYHSDHLGSAQFVTDWRGRQYEHIEYTPYGELWIEEVAAGLDKLPFRFTGKEMDEETGLYYYGARYLDPKYSRWLSGDPALGEYIPKAPIDDEAKKHNENLPGMGGVFNVVNLHLYHYAGNNPIKYEDPDGRVVDEITSQYHMTDYGGYTIPGSGIAVNFGGCAITLDANVCYSAGDTAATPATIVQDASNFDASGNLLWSNPLPDGISIQRVTSPLTVQKFNEYQDSETHYYIGIMVQYKGTPASPSTSPHWVGATSVYTDSAGTNYFVISPTSGNDGVMGTNPGGNNRGGLGWQNIPDVGIVVPVNRVTDYIIYTQQGGIQ